MNVNDRVHISPLDVFHVGDGIWSLESAGNTMYAAGWGAGVLAIDPFHVPAGVYRYGPHTGSRCVTRNVLLVR